jgi:hypothetical protein
MAHLRPGPQRDRSPDENHRRIAPRAAKRRSEVSKPIVKEEPALGETHRLLEGKDELRLPVELSPDAPAGDIELKVVVSFMTCDAAGCDPPSKIEQKLKVKVGAAAAEQKPATSGTAPVPAGPVASAKGVALGTPVELKKKHVTWRIAAAKEAPAGGTILVSAEYETAKSWHLYAPDHESPQGLGIATKLSTSFELDGRPEFPAPKVVKDENTLGETHRHLEGKGEIHWKLKVPAGQKAGPTRFDVRVDFMTCSTDGTCDLPDKAEATFETAILPAAAPPAGEGAKAEDAKVEGAKDEAKAGGVKTEPERLAGKDNAAAAPPPPAKGPALPAQAGAPVLPGGGTMLGLVFAAVLGGLIALIMPCTYPMIPLTITFFTKQAEARGGSVLGLALAYGAGIVLVFDIIGLLFAAPIASFAAHAITNLVFCAIFLVFALSFFGLFEIRLPSFVNNLVAGFVQRESASVVVAASRPRSGAPAGTAPFAHCGGYWTAIGRARRNRADECPRRVPRRLSSGHDARRDFVHMHRSLRGRAARCGGPDRRKQRAPRHDVLRHDGGCAFRGAILLSEPCAEPASRRLLDAHFESLSRLSRSLRGAQILLPGGPGLGPGRAAARAFPRVRRRAHGARGPLSAARFPIAR